jgi:hypothetical protein
MFLVDSIFELGEVIEKLKTAKIDENSFKNIT